jgi:2-polyprenyl-3-methyl-5-hydroxy-6-metoxy-1,4-benzoquinol methylase
LIPIQSKQSCYLCKRNDLKSITANLSFGTDIIQCRHCGFVQTEYVSSQAIDNYYGTYYRNDHNQATMDMFKRESAKQARCQLDYIDEIIPGATFENALEIGAGAGEMAKALGQRLIKVDVTELDPKYRKLLEADDAIKVIDDDKLNTLDFFNYYDLVVLSHVLEHMADPIHLIDMLSYVLKHDGHMFIEIPNEVEMVKQTGFQGKGHLYFFTIETFKTMIAIQGSFDILEIRTFDRSIDDFIASDYALPSDYDNQENPNGTSIRTMLVNRRPKTRLDGERLEPPHAKELLDDYSHRILKMHHQILKLGEHIQNLDIKYQASISEISAKYKSSLSEISEFFRKVNQSIGT